MHDKNNAFATRLREARELRGMTQTEVAQRAGLPAGSVNHFEHGRRVPSMANLVKVAVAVGVSADWLLSIDVIPLRRCEACAGRGLVECRA